ncbi:dihydrodipicolinate synthase family protein [Streptomyces sp. NPDC020379]|uniref:dihydrodipicolinate synthase family protein n=1 Tax=Streptomyces sp. NPDC020379 TaxID=3365071 RepID=UPI0037895448
MFHGVTVPLVTPLTGRGEVSRADVAALVASVRPHVTALLPALSTGEGWALTERQWRDMVGHALACAGGLPVLAGIQRPGTAEVTERARLAARLGAAAVVTTTPYGPDVTQREMYDHYAAVARAGLPVVVYHESEISRNAIEHDTLLRICALPGVAAVKDSAGDPAATRALLAAHPGVPVLQGLEHLVGDCEEVDGWVMALANVEPAICATAFAARPAYDAVVRDACERYGLDRPDWYRSLKTELHRRQVLGTDRTAAPEGSRT